MSTNPIYDLTDKEIQKRLTYDKEFCSIVANELAELRKQNIIKFDDNGLTVNHEKQAYINYYNQYMLPMIEANKKRMIELIKLDEEKEREHILKMEAIEEAYNLKLKEKEIQLKDKEIKLLKLNKKLAKLNKTK